MSEAWQKALDNALDQGFRLGIQVSLHANDASSHNANQKAWALLREIAEGRATLIESSAGIVDGAARLERKVAGRIQRHADALAQRPAGAPATQPVVDICSPEAQLEFIVRMRPRNHVRAFNEFRRLESVLWDDPDEVPVWIDAARALRERAVIGDDALVYLTSALLGAWSLREFETDPEVRRLCAERERLEKEMDEDDESAAASSVWTALEEQEEERLRLLVIQRLREAGYDDIAELQSTDPEEWERRRQRGRLAVWGPDEENPLLKHIERPLHLQFVPSLRLDELFPGPPKQWLQSVVQDPDRARAETMFEFIRFRLRREPSALCDWVAAARASRKGNLLSADATTYFVLAFVGEVLSVEGDHELDSLHDELAEAQRRRRSADDAWCNDELARECNALDEALEKRQTALYVAKLREVDCADLSTLAASDIDYLFERVEKGRIEVWGPDPESLDDVLR